MESTPRVDVQILVGEPINRERLEGLFEGLTEFARSIRDQEIRKVVVANEVDVPACSLGLENVVYGYRRKLVSASKRAVALSLNPFRFTPSAEEPHFHWPSISVHFEGEPIDDPNVRAIRGLECLREVSEVFFDEGFPAVNLLAMYN